MANLACQVLKTEENTALPTPNDRSITMFGPWIQHRKHKIDATYIHQGYRYI